MRRFFRLQTIQEISFERKDEDRWVDILIELFWELHIAQKSFQLVDNFFSSPVFPLLVKFNLFKEILIYHHSCRSTECVPLPLSNTFRIPLPLNGSYILPPCQYGPMDDLHLYYRRCPQPIRRPVADDDWHFSGDGKCSPPNVNGHK